VVRFLCGLGLLVALMIARCCRWIAVTAALAHQPATMLAHVNMILRGDPRMMALALCRCRINGATDPAFQRGFDHFREIRLWASDLDRQCRYRKTKLMSATLS